VQALCSTVSSTLRLIQQRHGSWSYESTNSMLAFLIFLV
jgi:hypothetical protein